MPDLPARTQRPAAGPGPHTVHFPGDVAPVRRTLAALSRRVAQICTALTADAVAAVDLTPIQYGAMACLNPKDGEPGLDQSGLGARLGIDRNSVSLLVDDLVAKGLLERRVNGADRRGRVVELTAKGMRLFGSVRPKVLSSHARALEALAPKDRDLLLDLLVRVIEVNGMHARPGAGRRPRSAKPAHPRSTTVT